MDIHRLRQAFGFGGDLAILANVMTDEQAIDPQRAWTFAVNHDIPLNGIFRGQIMDATDETLAWAWLLARGQGTPLLYSDNNESGDNRWRDLYRRPDISAMVAFHNALAGEPMVMISTSTCHLLFRRGERALVGINKCGEARRLDIDLAQHPLRAPGRYRDALSTHTLAANGGPLSVDLPPRSARLWLLQRNTCGRQPGSKEPAHCIAGAEAPTPRGPFERPEPARRPAPLQRPH